MKILLDTHVFLWSKIDVARLSATSLTILRDPDNELYLSAVSAVEIAIKSALGKLKLDMPASAFVIEGMKNAQIREVPMRIVHAIRLADLPSHHRDPFDRMLVVTAMEEGMTLLTNDTEIQKYPVQIAW